MLRYESSNDDYYNHSYSCLDGKLSELIKENVKKNIFSFKLTACSCDLTAHELRSQSHRKPVSNQDMNGDDMDA